ncbi:MAG TPA: hypothetical protein VGL05_30105 [Kribbella sp.]
MAGRVFRCGKCDGANVPAHHRLCPLRDPGDVAGQVVVVVWPPFGEPDDPRLARPMKHRDAPGTAD